MGTDSSGTGVEKCQWCGQHHEAICPRVKAFELDPATGRMTRVEFLTPMDYPRSSASVTEGVAPYPALKPRTF